MKQRLYRYACDECKTEVIAEETPRGWLRLISSSASTGLSHHSSPPVVWTPTKAKSLVLGNNPPHWCSVPCMLAHVERVANEALELAKLGIR